MTLEELENTLPNGLHDAELLRVSVDYSQRSLTLDVDVFVGKLDSPLALREAYRKARIKMTGLKFFVIEPPDPNYPYDAAEPSRIDICDMRKSLDRKLLQSVSEGAFLTSIWVNNWNAFAHIAAVGAELVWEDDRVTYRSRPERHLPGERIDIQ